MTTPADAIRFPERAPHRADKAAPEAGPTHRKPEGRAVVLRKGEERTNAVVIALTHFLAATDTVEDAVLDTARDHVRNVLTDLDQRSV